MKKMVLVLVLCFVGLTGCSNTCKYDGCNSEVYKEGYCKTHFYIMEAGSAVQDILGD